jgi:rhombotail lipoprotein
MGRQDSACRRPAQPGKIPAHAPAAAGSVETGGIAMKATGIFCACLILAGCASWFGSNTRQGVSSSLVDFLYPSGEVPPRQPGVTPNLQLPLTVGIAFVPSEHGNSALTEAERIELLNKVKAHFASRDYIQEISVIPEAYMRSRRGFESMEQLARLYGLDVLALVSYDQVAHTEERTSSLLYWTIVGAYVIEGNKNDVNTFVDTAVFDVPTRKLLFRAPGVSEIRSTSTLVGVESDVRAGQQKGFDQAMADMTVNLDKELDVFKERIRTDPSVRVTRADGSSYGGGGGGVTESGALAACVLLLALARRRRVALDAAAPTIREPIN